MRAMVIVLLLLAAEAFASIAQGAKRVELVLTEPQPPRNVAWPVTTGVPFPRGELTSLDNIILRDSDGKEAPLQAKSAATWDGPKGSIRWLTIDFIAQPGTKYALEYGPDVKATPADSLLRIEQKKDGVDISTGVLSVEVSAKGTLALGPVRMGRERRKEIAATGVGEQYFIDQNGERWGDGGERQIVVESRGPVRACVRVDGHYAGRDGRRLASYRTRYHFFAELPLIKVVNEFRIEGSTRDVRFKDIGFSLRMPLDRASWRTAVDASGDRGNQVLTLTPEKGASAVSLFQSTYRHYGNPECRGGLHERHDEAEKQHRKESRVGEWLQTGDKNVTVTGSMRWFWQQFPAEWEATPDGLTLHLWSPRGGELDFGLAGIRRFFGEAGEQYLLDWKGVRAPQTPIERFFFFAGRSALERGDADGKGSHKHHEFYLHFGKAYEKWWGQEYGRLAADPPLALASAEWNCATDVMGPIAARPNGSPAEAIVDRLFDLGRDMQDGFGDYGWWLFGAGPHYSYQWDAKTGKHYADPRRFDFHTYTRDTQHWWNYLRSGERKFLDWALPAENHWVDIAVSHEPLQFFTEYRGGEKAPATLPWPRGDWAIDSTIHYLRHHDTGEAWLRGQSQFWATYHRTLETTALAYYLTGDERFNDVLGYWRDYWSDLAGKTSASADFQPWHRSQAWFRPTSKGEKAKTWAEMIRDYAPFNSGSRHQMTLFFNLATLFEHTWDPKIGQAVREYADAFLDPTHPIGVWRSGDNHAPAHAEAPIMAHFWAPALWRYARATNDPRMPEVFRRYFDACLGADPFHEDVGVYSNVQIGYAYAFSKDPRHLRPALSELEHLQPNAAPLAKSEDLNVRLYNPYAPIRSYTGVPRLIWALDEAKRTGVDLPPPPICRPQRTLLAWRKQADMPVEATLWGYNRDLSLIGPDGKPFKDFQATSKTYASAVTPFDRVHANFEVFFHRLTIPASAPAGWYVLNNALETAILDLKGGKDFRCQAGVPVAIHPGEIWRWKVPGGLPELRLETGQPKDLRVRGSDGKELAGTAGASSLTIRLKEEDAGKSLRFENPSAAILWFRIADQPAERCWLSSTLDNAGQPEFAKLPPAIEINTAEEFGDGRFGKGILIAPGRALHLPDHMMKDGAEERLFDMQQGTLEFWVKRLWDERLAPPVHPSRMIYMSNGLINAWSPWKLPLNEWAHVALVWRPLKKDPNQVIVQIYVNGLDQANYRSTYWEGYGDRPFAHPGGGKWLREFLAKAAPGTAFRLDELRLSSIPRYTDLDTDFGGQQPFNPHRFSPPDKAFQPDGDTRLLFHFDGDLKSDPVEGRVAIEGRWDKTEGKKK